MEIGCLVVRAQAKLLQQRQKYSGSNSSLLLSRSTVEGYPSRDPAPSSLLALFFPSVSPVVSPAFRLLLLWDYLFIHSNFLLFQGLGPFKDMALAFPEEEWRHMTPAQIDCFGEYVEPQDCRVSPPGKTVSIPLVRN